MIKKILRGMTLGALSADTLIRASYARISLAHCPIRPWGTTGTTPEKLSFVSFSITPWYGVWQRPQQFATRFSNWHRGIYVDQTGLQHVVHGEAHPEWADQSDNLSVYCPRVLPMGKTRSSIIDFNDALVVKRLHKIIQKNELDRPVLITNTPLSDGIANLYPWRAVAFDVIDDFTKWAWSPHDSVQREKRLFDRADTVFTGTYSLYEKKRQFHPETEFIPCGVEVDHFLKANNPETRVPSDIEEIKKRGPVIGYFGGLNERIDADLLVQIAEQIPTASVVLLGPIFADFGLSDFEDQWASRLPYPSSPGFGMKPKPDNLHILGIRKYDELPAYLKAFDVCLLPYVLSDATVDIHPVKGLEYLASGRPVVSTPLPDVVKFYKGIIDVADDASEFVEIIRRHIENPDDDKRQERIEFAKPRTWENMALRMRSKIFRACGLNDEEDR